MPLMDRTDLGHAPRQVGHGREPSTGRYRERCSLAYVRSMLMATGADAYAICNPPISVFPPNTMRSPPISRHHLHPDLPLLPELTMDPEAKLMGTRH